MEDCSSLANDEATGAAGLPAEIPEGFPGTSGACFEGFSISGCFAANLSMTGASLGTEGVEVLFAAEESFGTVDGAVKDLIWKSTGRTPFFPCASNETGLNADDHIAGLFLVAVSGPTQLRGLSTAVAGFLLSNGFDGFAGGTSGFASDWFAFLFSAALAADEMKLRSAARSE